MTTVEALARGGFGFRAGSGTPLLLVHGLGGTWADWRPVLPLLTEHHEVFACTMAGHHGGPAVAPEARHTVCGVVDVLEQAMDASGIGTAHIVGNSLGGRVALELARRGRARSVVCFSPAAACRRPTDVWRVQLKVGGSLLISRLAPLRSLLRRPRVHRLVAGMMVHRPELLHADRFAEFLRGFAGCAAAGALLLDLARRPVIEPLDLPGLPIVVAWPHRDRVIPFERYGRPLLRLLPGARYVPLPGVGHVPMTDDADLVARTILDATLPVDRQRAPCGAGT